MLFIALLLVFQIPHTRRSLGIIYVARILVQICGLMYNTFPEASAASAEHVCRRMILVTSVRPYRGGVNIDLLKAPADKQIQNSLNNL